MIKQNLGRLVGFVVILSAICIGCIYASNQDFSAKEIVIFKITSVFLGLGTIVMVFSFIKNKYQLVVDEEGIKDFRFDKYSSFFIPWDEISNMHLKWTYSYKYGEYLVIEIELLNGIVFFEPKRELCSIYKKSKKYQLESSLSQFRKLQNEGMEELYEELSKYFEGIVKKS